MPAVAPLVTIASKRLQPVVLALLCLMAMQLLGAASRHPQALPMGAVRVAITR